MGASLPAASGGMSASGAPAMGSAWPERVDMRPLITYIICFCSAHCSAYCFLSSATSAARRATMDMTSLDATALPPPAASMAGDKWRGMPERSEATAAAAAAAATATAPAGVYAYD